MFRPRRFVTIIAGALALLFACGFVSLLTRGGEPTPIQAPAPTEPASKALEIVLPTVTPTAEPTETPAPLPTEPPPPTETPVPILQPTDTPPPLVPTETPLSLGDNPMTLPVVGESEEEPATRAGGIELGGDCDPSYPDVCIPPIDIAGKDLNCGDVPQFARFRVLAPDPHGFDGNQDGVGCENN